MNHSATAAHVRGLSGRRPERLPAVPLRVPDEQQRRHQPRAADPAIPVRQRRRTTPSSRAAPRTTAPGRTTSAGLVETVGGDGGQSGFNANNPAIRYPLLLQPPARRELRQRHTHQLGLDQRPASTRRRSFYMPLTADPVTAGTVFNGLQHIWRSTDNGGQQAYLDEHCNELTGDFSHALWRLGHAWGRSWRPVGRQHRQLRRGRRAGTATPPRCGQAPGWAGVSSSTQRQRREPRR